METTIVSKRTTSNISTGTPMNTQTTTTTRVLNSEQSAQLNQDIENLQNQIASGNVDLFDLNLNAASPLLVQ